MYLMSAPNNLLIDQVFRLAAEQSRDAILISDKDNQIIYVNNMFSQLTEYTEDDVIGKNPSILKSGIQTDEYYAQLWATIAQKGEWRGELWNRAKSGRLFYEHQHIMAIADDSGATQYYISIFYDRTRQLREAQTKRFNERYDRKTQLPNERKLQEYVKSLSKNQQTSFTYITFNYLDLKDINSTYGTEFGDLFLSEIALRIKSLGHRKFFAARISGGQFALITPYQSQQPQRLSALQHIARELKAPIVVQDREIFPQVEIGVLEQAHEQEFDLELFTHSEHDSHRDPASSNQDFYFINQSNKDKIRDEFELAQRLQLALKNDDFEIYFQPQVNSVDQSILGAEALLRWFTPDGQISPGEFLPVAEKYNLMNKLDEYAVNKVFEHIHRAKTRRIQLPRIAINISDQLIPLNVIEALMAKHNIQPDDFELEITEKLIAAHDDETNLFLQAFKDRGIHTSIDDFGTGYSSLARLRHLKVNKLKIDKSFIDHIKSSLQDREILLSIIGIGKALKLTVLAEGVETPCQWEFLQRSGCDLIQGFLFSKPVDLPTLLSLLAAGPVHNDPETEQCEFVTQCHSANRG